MLLKSPQQEQSIPQPLATRLHYWSEHPVAITAVVILFVVLIGLNALRILNEYSVPKGGDFDWANRGLSDFHNGVYFPTQAFFDGFNPYSQTAVQPYNLTRATPPYSPITFMLHYPFTLVPVQVADVIFFIFNISMIVALSWCSITMSGGRVSLFAVLGIASLFLLSRPGHITIFTGYFTMEMVIGTIVALHYARSRPFVSAVGMLLASAKPTYILPLAILMICRRNYRATVVGVMLCAIFAGAGLGWLAYNSSVEQVLVGIQEGQDAHRQDPTEFPVNSWTRVDLMGMIAKIANWNPAAQVYLISMLILFVVPGIIVFRTVDLQANHGATGLTSWIVILLILLGLYHHSYDCLLLVVPWVGITFFGAATLPELSNKTRYLLALLTAVPAGNYLSTQSAMERLGFEQHDAVWQSITMINGICLLAALIILLAHCCRLLKTSRA